jgi:pimeloyl-ACP methyl ester carboxylesterase
LQFALLHYVNRNDPSIRASLAQLAKAWWGELVATAWVFNWWQPFRRGAIADYMADKSAVKSHKPGIVLVHGFFCNRGFWTRWMHRLQGENRMFVAVDLEPAFGSIDDYISTIEHAVEKVRAATGMPPILIGHSMGGLAIRAWLATRNSTGAVQRVITLGTPHQGTWLGQFSHSLNGKQMRINSPWLKILAEKEAPTSSSLFVCFYSNCDNIVFPVSSATREGADNRLMLGLGHVAMAQDPQVIDACWALME